MATVQDCFLPDKHTLHTTTMAVDLLTVYQYYMVPIWLVADVRMFTTHVVFCVYDYSDYESFTNLQPWILELRLHARPETQIVLLGAQCDKLR